MKATVNSLSRIICLFVFFSVFALQAQETHVIPLYVDTEAINTNTPDNELGTVCNFNQEAGVTNEDFMVEVNQGDIIQWRGIANNGTDIVHIERIIFVRGTNPFPANELSGTGEPARAVTVEAVNKTVDTPDGDCKYKVVFSVIRNGEDLDRNFNIDPILRVR